MSIICSYYTDVAIRQLAGIIGSAYHIKLLAKFHFLSSCIIAPDVEACLSRATSRSLHQTLDIADIGRIGVCIAAACHISDLLATIVQAVGSQGDRLIASTRRSNCHATCGKSRSDSILSNSRQALDTSQLIIQCIGEIRVTLGKCQVVACLESDSRSSLDSRSCAVVGFDVPSRTIDGLGYIRCHRYAVSCRCSYRAIGTGINLSRIDIILNISPIRGLGHLRGRIIAIREGDFLVGTDIGRGRTVSYLETACDFIANGFQLIFCSRPACLVGGLSDCPILIVQSGDLLSVPCLPTLTLPA